MKKENSRPLTVDEKTEQYIYRKIDEAAAAYEQKLNADPTLDDVHVTQEMRDDMMRRIAAIEAEGDGIRADAAGLPEEDGIHVDTVGLPDEYGIHADAVGLSDEDRHALEIGRKALRIGRHRKLFRRLGVAAVLVLSIFGLSMTSQANRLWLLKMWNQMWGTEQVFEAQRWNEAEDYAPEMERMYSDILEKTGIHAVQFFYEPEGMTFNSYVANDLLKSAKIFYQYGDTILTVDMFQESQQTSNMVTFDGEVLETIELETPCCGKVTVMAISAPKDEIDYAAEFLYEGCQYTIYGILPKEEFLELIKNLHFY